MPRQRNTHRDGWVELDKRTRPHRWVARWTTNEMYVDDQGRTRYRFGRHQLGLKTSADLPTKAAAKTKWESIRDQLIRNVHGKVRDLDIRVQAFCEQEFIPLRRSGWNDATKAKMEYYFDLLFQVIGEMRIADVATKHLKACLDGLASKYCESTVSGVYVLARSIFRLAVEEKYIDIGENPTRLLKMPRTRDRDKTVLEMAAVQKLEDALVGRDRIIFQIFARCGTRAGEAFGCQWQDLLPNQTLAIRRTYSRGVIKPPKTRRSKKPIYLPESLYNDLLKLKEVATDASPTGWIFPAHHARRRRLSNGELEEKAQPVPLDYSNWFDRNLKPVADQLGIRVNLQIMRRTFASLANDSGADLKDIQAQLRHAKTSTTADIYVQPIPVSVRLAMEELDRRLRERTQEQLQVQAPVSDQIH